MLITYFGPGDFLQTGLFDDTGALSIELVSATTTRVVVRNPSNGAVTTFLGSGFTADPIANPGGLVTSATVVNSSGQVLATVAGFNWPALDFLTALTALEGDDETLWNQLLSRQDITFDAHAARAGAEAWFGDVTSHVNLIGSAYSDTLSGGAGDDTLNPGLSPMNDRDVLYASAGADRIIFTDVQPGRGYIQLSLAELPLTGATGASTTINGDGNTGSISHAFGTTTLVDIARALDWHTSGFAIFGTDNDDSFTVNGGAETWIALAGSRGADQFNLTLTGEIRLIFDGSWYEYATQAVNINLATGVISDDGFGFVDTLTVTDGAGLLEIYATSFSDTIIGSARSFEIYTLLGGNDTLAAGGGHDLLRYDRNEYNTGVSVDLTAGTATGYAGGVAFVHNLSGVDEVWGSNRFNDTLQGAAGADSLDGLGGADVLRGLEGRDHLWGGDGADTLNGGTGDDVIYGGASSIDLRDIIYGGDGNDSIDAGYGNDLAFAGIGNDTVEGGFGADEINGQAGNDLLSGGALSDLIFGGDGFDFINGGFGADRLNGGLGADRFYHLGIRDHGSDWVQDYNATQGDVLVAGIAGATRAQFLVQFSTTPGAGQAGVQEAFITYRPTGQVLWALIDGAAQTQINLMLGAQTFDLLA